MIVIIYVGAIAILFLFVLMMLNLKKEETNLMRYVPIGVIIGLIMIGEV
ncbi:MAG: NADH-quinone oxidoreductase subunit J [Bacteroidetes bacterium]|nr:NADH-quinone oxidoreductase subunit J [Bacteroidota bacterium]